MPLHLPDEAAEPTLAQPIEIISVFMISPNPHFRVARAAMAVLYSRVSSKDVPDLSRSREKEPGGEVLQYGFCAGHNGTHRVRTIPTSRSVSAP
jgi:hypothetical protein